MALKQLFLVMLMQAAMLIGFAQEPACESFKTGSFKIMGKGQDTTYTYITRTKTEQIETNDSYNYKVIFSITWIGKCTYELRPKKVIKGDPAIMGDGTNFVRSRIKDITSKGYTAETTASFFKEAVDFNVEIVR